MNVQSKSCKPTEHNYQPAPTDIGVERRSVAKGTEIWLGYVCSKCGDSIQRQISFWPGKKTVNYAPPTEDDVPF